MPAKRLSIYCPVCGGKCLTDNSGALVVTGDHAEINGAFECLVCGLVTFIYRANICDNPNRPGTLREIFNRPEKKVYNGK